jgi:desulfoferrodoxin (superoxide reductase-like protein)
MSIYGTGGYKMNKEEFIEWLKILPDNVQIFKSDVGKYDDVNIKIFVKTKSKEFFEWYFGP